MSKQSSAPERVPARFSRPMGVVRDLPIWTKLGLIMIVPTLATIVVGTAGLLDQVQQATVVERARSLTVVSGDAGSLVHQLQSERALAIRLLNAPAAEATKIVADYKKQQGATDKAYGTYRLDRSTIADVPENLRVLLDKIEGQLGELPVMRTQVEGLTKLTLSNAENRYRVLISDLLAIRDLSSQLSGDTTLTDRLRAAAAVATEKEYLSQERVVVLQALATGDMSQAVRREYIGTIKGQDLAKLQFTSVSTQDQKELYSRTVTGPELRETLLFEGALDGLADSQNPNTVVNAGSWDTAMAGRSERLNTVELALNQQAQQTATALGEAVQRRVLVETGLLLVTLLLGVLFAWLVARSMARSLRDLRQGALAVAQYGLPQAVARLRDPALSTHLSPHGVAMQIAEPLPVRSKDEFGQVTEAFNAVHLEAVRTAAEQAALRSSVATMFVNLARRSQILVDRLIGHLDRLERGEQDPDRLSELFQLDHLATRMRRNDENLLVLAGADSTRVQREPAALMDVLRAAQSEVEHYTRIEFTIIDQDIEIAAHAVNDLVHLVAELFDNATAFSSPDTSIMVEARRVGDRAVLQVEDRGIGMSPEQYAELNERLATPPMVDVAVSRMMGLVVVARLAARHGVKVELRSAQQNRGTVADVLLPSGVLVPRSLAGRSQAPAGFPAARAPEMPPTRPLFPAPLALESGSGPMGWPSSGDDHAGQWPTGGAPAFTPPPYEPPSPYTAPPPAPAYGGPPSGGGLGAALAGDYGNAAHSGNGANGANGGGRAVPAWYDLTGAGQRPDQEPPRPTDDPLPQRRPGSGGGWGEAEPETTGPRQGPPAEGGWGAPAPHGGPSTPPSGFPSASPAGAGYQAPTTGFAGAAAGFGGSPAGAPPAWPPVPGSEEHSGDAVPGIPERLSASLDMTSELPRMRGGQAPPDTGYAPMTPSTYQPAGSGYAAGAAAAEGAANDMTMELPIFRELESAWFRTEAAPAPADPYRAAPDSSADPSSWPGGSDSWADETAGAAAMAGSARSGSGYRTERSTGSDGVRGPAEGVSWRSVADDGWTAAQAAMTPQDGGTTDMGLPRRVPMAQLVPGGVDTQAGVSDRRSPEAVRGLLSAYHRGVQRGRGSAGPDDESDPSQTSGREQEA